MLRCLAVAVQSPTTKVSGASESVNSVTDLVESEWSLLEEDLTGDSRYRSCSLCLKSHLHDICSILVSGTNSSGTQSLQTDQMADLKKIEC